MRAKHRIIIAATAVALALSGCASGAAGGPTATSGTRPTGTSAPSAVRVAAPACATLATQQEVVSLVGGTGAPAEFTHLQSGGITWQATWSALASNGAVCGWGEGALVEQTGTRGNPLVFLQLAPGLEDSWNALATEIAPGAGSAYDGAVSRGGRCDGTMCFTEVLVNGAWLHVEADAATALDESAFHAFVQSVVTRYRAAPAPTVLSPHARTCDDPALSGAVAEVFGEKGDLAAVAAAFTLSQGLVRAGYLTTCRFDSSSNPRAWETAVTVLDNVQPSLLATYRAGVDHPESKPVDVAALPGDASGVFEPTVDSERTIVDVLDGGHWLSLVTYGPVDSSKTVSLAQKLLAGAWVK